MRYIGVAVLCGLVVAGVVGYSIAARSHSDPLHAKTLVTTTPERATDERLVAVIERMEARLSALEAKQEARAEDKRADPSSSQMSNHERESVQEDVREREIRRATETERRLTRESRDSFWATATEDKLRDAVKLAFSGKDHRVASLSCLTTICSVEIDTSDPGAASGAMRTFMTNVDNIAGMESKHPVRSGDGSYRIAYRFYRKGYPIPGEESL